MSKGRILIVDDNVDNQELVRFILERADYEVMVAMDGNEGLKKTLELKPDLVLLDMSMPEMDGWDVARKLKAEPEAAGICVVALTAHILPGDRKKALDAGCDGYISKPLDVPNFTGQIASYLRKRNPGRNTGSLTF